MSMVEQTTISKCRPRVVLADDHRILCEALARLLEVDCDVVGTASDGRELLELVAEHQPDIAVVDISMPALNGIEAAHRLKVQSPEVKLIFLTVNEDPDIVAEVLRAGAVGFLLKKSAGSELLTAIAEAMNGRSYVTPLANRQIADHDNNSNISPRQLEVLRFLSQGRTMKEVAQILEITPRTVAFHKYALMKSLRVETTAELVRYAIRHGLIDE